jgi:hypothetical protein
MYIKQLLIIFCLSILAACASTSESDESSISNRGDCIHEPSIRGYRVLDERSLLVDASANKVYHVTLQRRAFGLDSSWGIGFRSPTGRVCASFSEVVFSGDFDRETVRIASIRQLAPEEEEKLLIQFGKKEPEIKHTPAPQEVKGADVEELDPDKSE